MDREWNSWPFADETLNKNFKNQYTTWLNYVQTSWMNRWFFFFFFFFLQTRTCYTEHNLKKNQCWFPRIFKKKKDKKKKKTDETVGDISEQKVGRVTQNLWKRRLFCGRFRQISWSFFFIFIHSAGDVKYTNDSKQPDGGAPVMRELSRITSSSPSTCSSW